MGADKGTRETNPATLSTNRVCVSCVAGVTFQNETNKAVCYPVSNCSVGYAQDKKPSVSSDRVCTLCDGIAGFSDQPGLESWSLASCFK